MYKTAEELGINDWEYDGLLWLKDALPKMIHVPDPTEASPANGLLFNMDWPASQFDCGAVCCLGGWLHMHSVETGLDNAKAYVNSVSGGLEDLFFPPNEFREREVIYGSITPSQAVSAIENYLTKGRANWPMLLTEANLWEGYE